MIPTRQQTTLLLLKLTKVAVSILEASSPSLVVVNRILVTYYVDLWTWRYLLGYRRDREELFKVFRQWYCLEAAFVLAWQILAFPLSGYFIHILFAAWPRVYSVLYGLFYGKYCGNVDACVCNRYQAAFFPSPLRPGYEAKIGHDHIRTKSGHVAPYKSLYKSKSWSKALETVLNENICWNSWERKIQCHTPPTHPSASL